ncbi:MAG: hypothetical protein AAGA96_17645 [Verrucomicrobiota bacterium]
MADSNIQSDDGENRDGELTIPPNLKAKLEDFQNRLWSTKMAEGALAGLAGLGFTYLLVFGLDRIFDTPAWLRTALLIVGFAVPAIGLPLKWRRWVNQQRTLEQVARFLKQHFPRLGDELLGIVELANSSSESNSRVLVEAAMKQVDDRLADRELGDAVPAKQYRLWLYSAAAVVALSSALILTVSTAAQNAMARWLSPWNPVDRYTFAQIEPLPEKVIVPFAEKFELEPELTDDTAWKPESATVKLSRKIKLESNREEETYRFEVPPRKEQGSLSLRVGDERKRIEVEPLSRPELTHLEATIRLPDYLRYSEDPVIPVRGSSLSILEGASAAFQAHTSRELSTATVNGDAATIEGDAFSSSPIDIVEVAHQTFEWTDIHGLQAKSPLEIQISPVEDAAPDIFANQVTEERIILEDELITFDLSASDDYGLKGVGLQWWASDADASDESFSGEKPVAAGAPEKKEITSKATFSAKREGIAPQTIQLRAFAEDYLPDRDRSYSPTFVLHILSPEDHAHWLTQEFGKWFRNAREVYEREQQLHESNKALRELPLGDLDTPDNRRKLREQASAEGANARKLGALTTSGRDLVKQATKNDEFDAERLESWATMMRALDDIAEKRMPSVADLLSQASEAQGIGTPRAPSQSNGSKPPGPSVGKQDSPRESQSANKKESRNPNAAGAPSVSDHEKGIGSPQAPQEAGEQKPAQSSPPALRLPETTLDAVDTGSKPPSPPKDSPASEKLDQAITEQQDLLAEFAKVADQLQEILSSLEASTFVKRLKAASRKQFEIATTLNDTIAGGFGLPRHRIEQQLRAVGDESSQIQEEQSEKIYDIQSDLEAYFQRKQDLTFKNVLDQMRDLSVVSEVKDIGEEMLVNLSGRSISASEFWGDTLDRWAEELVAASNCEACQGGSKDSLPPEIVLDIMKVLQEQMYLRDETREMQASRLILSPDVYESKVRPLELTQADLRERIDFVVGDIEKLPNASTQFVKEVQLLTLVSDIMRQARAVLSRPDTGPEAIGAQTEAIELLLQSKRQKNSGGGGGGGASPGGGGTADGSAASLSDISLGDDDGGESAPLSREVDQSTGKAGRELPEEFRRGLDQYFNQLESN